MTGCDTSSTCCSAGPCTITPRRHGARSRRQLTAFFVAIHARFVHELAALPPGVEVVVFSGGGEP